jgi:hypothetical protein
MKALKLYGIAVSSGLLLGALVGWHFGRTITSGRLAWEEMLAADAYGQLSYLQYLRADSEHARQALLGFTDFSKSISKLPSAKGDKALPVDTGRTYLRLAVLAELAGNASLSHEYVLKAQETFRTTGADIPEEKLNQQVTKLAEAARSVVPPS